MIDLSVIICAHNSRVDYLQRVLNALQYQKLPPSQWELLLVDNASSRPLASDWDLSWHPNARHILEHELGLSAARQRGVRESIGNVIVFVDDDNVLDQNYLSLALDVERRWPKLGTWGSGATVPEYELQPAHSVSRLLPYLALRESNTPRWGNVFGIDATPWGAGLCVRRQVAEAYCRHCKQSPIQITGRRGKALSSGEDVEMSHIACEMGLGMAVFPDLKLIHLIPKERVSGQYLLRMFEGSATSHYVLTHKWSGQIPSHPFRPRGLLSVVKNLVLLRGLDRRIYLKNLCAVLNARRAILEKQH